MNQNLFNIQIDRLKEVWPTSFPAEKIRLIWEKVFDLSDHWIKKSAEHFLSHNRAAPLPADFIELARLERNSNNLNNSSGFPTHPSQIHPSENSIFSKEDIAEMFNMMRKRLNGEITYEELEHYSKCVQAAVDSNR